EDGIRYRTVTGVHVCSSDLGHGFDVLRIQVGGTVGEIDTAVTERGGRALIGREHARVDGPVVDRQPVEDDQRLVAAADRADAAEIGRASCREGEERCRGELW